MSPYSKGISQWIPTNKWITAQAVLLTTLVNASFDSKLTAAFAIQAVATYFTSNRKLPG